jgi:Ca-activated chloride channel family protein
MYTFDQPYFLALIIVFAIAHIWFKPRLQSMIFPNMHLISSSIKINNLLSSVFKWIVIISAIIALASPIKEDKITQKGEGYNICLILDASLSMNEGGFNRYNLRQNRFDVVKEIVDDFIAKRVNDNLSIVVFGDFSFVALPLSFDKKVAHSILSTLQVGMAGRQTAIYDALAQSIKSLNVQKAKKKIAILLTDGQNTAGTIPYEVVMRMAKEHNVKIYTIGIGRSGEYDTSMLKEMSNNTGGKFFQASNNNRLERIYKQIDKLEKYKIKSSSFSRKIYYYHYPLAIAIFFLILYIFITNRKSLF